ncbi:hypothetical protein NPIL_80911 [Nephila pilipes]|uniref:Uncharacterized protein n=1 Tax=Nephila pilipes TaxID=299642 RepID=A0A8X6MBV2_NEPPI|nr:hypothetical protein NPIL_80911 [Nephila pilipes]
MFNQNIHLPYLLLLAKKMYNWQSKFLRRKMISFNEQIYTNDQNRRLWHLPSPSKCKRFDLANNTARGWTMLWKSGERPSPRDETEH